MLADLSKFHSSICAPKRQLNSLWHIRHKGPPTEQEQNNLAHQKALDVVIDYIKESVIGQEEVVELRSLRLLYVKDLDKNGFPVMRPTEPESCPSRSLHLGYP